MGQFGPVRRHRVVARDRPDYDHVFVSPLVPHDSDAPDRQQDREGLPEFPIVAGCPDLFHQNRIGFPQDIEPLFGDLADDPDGKPRAGKRLPPDHVIGHPELLSEQPNLVLEEVLQRFDELQFHPFGEPPHVVVGFDDGAWPTEGRAGFDQVRVEGSLGEEFRITDLPRLFIENLDENPSDDFPLPLRVRHPAEAVEEGLPSPGETDVHLKMLAEEDADFFGLLESEKTVVDEDAGEPAADRPVKQNCRNRRVDAPRETENHALVADRRPDFRNGVANEGAHRPALHAAADAEEEVLQHPLPLRGVDHLRVELETVEPAFRIFGGGRLGVFGPCRTHKTLRQSADPVAVAHPAARLFFDAGENGAPPFPDVQLGKAVLPLVRADHAAAQRIHHELETVADSQDRDSETEDPRIRPRCMLFVDRGGPAGQDNALRPEFPDSADVDTRRLDLAVYLMLPNTAGDQLVVLGSEVDDQDHDVNSFAA